MRANFVKFRTSDTKFGLVIQDRTMKMALKLCISAENAETGGILFGRYSIDKCWAEVTGISGPPGDSSRTRTSFIRGVLGLQRYLDTIWNSKKQYYLGEWHYHPFAKATASSVDANQLKEHSESTSLRCPEPIMLIIGGNPNGLWHVKAYVHPKGGSLCEMVKLSYE